MPILAGMLSSESTERSHQFMPSGFSVSPELLDSLSGPAEIYFSASPAETAAPKTPTASGVTSGSMPSTPGLNPYLMPSIATTIASINEESKAASLAVGSGSGARMISSRRNPSYEGIDMGNQNKQREQIYHTNRAEASLGKSKVESLSNTRIYKVDWKDGTITETEKRLVADTIPSPSKSAEKQRVSSNDATASDECFTPNEVFSKIPGWVKPSTSTFMSFPSSPDPNRSGGLGIPFNTSSMTPDNAKSVSSKFYSAPETAATSNTGITTPAVLRPSTPRYHPHPSMDDSSSFYPSRETSRCQSLVSSIGAPQDMSVWTTSAAARILSRTPRPSDRVNNNSSGGHLAFRFSWMNRSASKSPEPITNKDAFTRSSSLAHLKRSQKRGQDLQGVSRANPQDPSKGSRSKDLRTEKYSEIYENIHLQGCSPTHTAAEGLDYAQASKNSWLIDNSGSQKQLIHENVATPGNLASNSTEYTSWRGFPARMSSLPVPNGIARDTRNWGPSNAWKSEGSKGNTFTNYGKTEKKSSLKNSISLGERMWERHGTRNRDQAGSRRTPMPNAFAGPIPDLDLQGEDGETHGRRIYKRDMIRSRSMTLRRTFTNSIAKLRGRVSFSGSSKTTAIPSSPIDKPGNIDRFYQVRHEGRTSMSCAPEVLDEKVEVELSVSESNMSSIIFKPTLPKEMLELESSIELSKDTSPGSGNIITQHRDLEPQPDTPLTLDTTPNPNSRLPTSADKPALDTASEGPRSRPWSTIYDDCVTSPSTEGESGNEHGAGTDSELETPMSGFFDAHEQRVRQVWRDAKESIEIAV